MRSNRMNKYGMCIWQGRWLFALLMGWVALGTPRVLYAEGESEYHQAWKLVAGYSASEALPLFETATPSAERQLGIATVLLGKYPQTPQNVDAAELILQELLSEDEQSESRAAAYYLLGRIAHIFREGRMVEAAYYYRQLREKFPENQLADIAAVKLAMITLSESSPDGSEKNLREEVELLEVPNHRSARSDFHTLLAEYYMERGYLSAALERLIMVRELGVNRGINKADLLVQIGRLAEELGRKAIARPAYEDFLGEFPTDTRNYMVQQQLVMMDEEDTP